MHSMIRKFIVIGVTITILSGCGLISKKTPEPAPVEPEEKAASSTISRDEDTKIKGIISSYFTKLYKVDPDTYSKDLVAGAIPADLVEFLSKSKVDIGSNNVENGIHLPRYIELNGLTAFKYEILLNGKEPGISSGFTQKRDSINIYLTKIELKAKTVPNGVFDTAYTLASNGYYEKKGNIDEAKAENIKMEVQYEVGVIKEEGNYKIVYAKEAIEKQGFKYRVNKLNNEHVKRLSWLNINKAENGKDYIVKADGERYEKEKAVITSLFDNFKKLNSDNVNMVNVAWNKGEAEFKSIMQKLGVSKDAKSNELLLISSDYKTKIGLDSLPLQSGMHKFNNIDKFVVQPHPAYSDVNRKYIVSFETKVDMKNGIPPEGKLYKYDFNVEMVISGDKLMVGGLKLNEFVNASNKTNTTKDTKKK